ncbi:TPA: ATP-binding protein [Acinetobacter baumannii]|nr:ATP-binding protein [Acinetobacter baumannii]
MNIRGDIPHAKIENINIPLNRRNLIITGKNGSGKTSFLNSLSNKINIHLKKEAQNKEDDEKHVAMWIEKQKNTLIGSLDFTLAQKQIEFHSNRLSKINDGLRLDFINEYDLIAHYDDLRAVFVSFKAMRMAEIIETKQTSSIEDEKNKAIQSLKSTNPESFGKKLEQHLVNIKVNQSLALTEDNNQDQAKQFQEWFDNFDSHLKFLFENESAHLVFYRQNFKFKISLDNREFDFQTLSSGYLAIFEILADLLVRSEFFEITPHELQGIVLIDEIDAHLHISLQKKIMPFFTRLFPQIQFIVSTHSPFVITSTDDDTVVYDISSDEFYEDDLSKYSIESIIKELFHVETDSLNLKNSIDKIYNAIQRHDTNLDILNHELKNLQPYKSKLNPEAKSIYMQAINYLIDHEALGSDLDV